MENKSKVEWEEHLSNCSLNEARIILVLEYLLYFLFSSGFIFIFYFCVIFGIAFYFVNYKGVMPIKMYLFSFVLHFILFYITDIFLNDKSEIEDIKRSIKETKKQIKAKKKWNKI